MTDNPRLRQLLDELHESQATPEEVCRSCPELLPEVRARWQAVCRVRAELDAPVAHDWLRQELTSWGKALGNGNAQTNAWVQQRLRHCQADVSLGGVRAKDALARLPDEERMLWQRLWSDVDALLKKPDGKSK